MYVASDCIQMYITHCRFIYVVQCPCGMPLWACAGPIYSVCSAVPQGCIAEHARCRPIYFRLGSAIGSVHSMEGLAHGASSAEPRRQVRTQAFGRHVSHQTQVLHSVVYGTVLCVLSVGHAPVGVHRGVML